MDIPRGISVTLTTASTAYQLSALLITADAEFQQLLNRKELRCQQVVIQNPLTAGGTRVYVGNDDVTATNQGSELAAGIGVPLGFFTGANPVNLANIWLMASTDNAKVNVWVFEL